MQSRRRPIPLTLAAGALLTSTGFLASATLRDASPVYEHVGHAALAWHVMLLVGGLAIVVGVRSASLRLEAAGLVLIAGGCLFYIMGAATTGGLASWTACCLIGSAAASELLRAYALTKGRPWS
jgi:hypothetical protein